MPIKRRKTPGFGQESLESAKARDWVERRERTKDINWSSEVEMEELMTKKRKAEEAEPYNKPKSRKRSQAVAKEVAKRSVGAKETEEFGFMLPSSTSPDEVLLAGEKVLALPAAANKTKLVAIAVGDAAADEPAKTAEEPDVVGLAVQPTVTSKKRKHSKEGRPAVTLEALKLALGDEKTKNKSKRALRHARWAMKKRMMREQQGTKAAIAPTEA